MQANKKNIAQNILKNQRFIQKYKQLDAQLQNTLFEYDYLYLGYSKWEPWKQCKMWWMGWPKLWEMQKIR